MQLLVLYSTSEGHTEKIARTFVDVFEELGHEVFLTATSDPGFCDPATFDAAVLCAPIHMSAYPGDFIQFAGDWKSSLSAIPTALVTTSLFVACEDDKEQAKAAAYPATLSAKTGWKPDFIYNVAGSLNYPAYDIFMQWVMKRAAKSLDWPTDTSVAHEFTDWEALKDHAHEFARSVKAKAA